LSVQKHRKTKKKLFTARAEFKVQKDRTYLMVTVMEELLQCPVTMLYRGADNSLARPGRKQVTATEDFDVHVSCL